MKRWITLLFAAWMLLTLTVPAFADGRGPAFTSYTVVCDRETPYYEEDWDDNDSPVMEKAGTVPAGTKLKVENEYETGGVLYGSVRLSTDEDDYKYFFIRLTDVEFNNDRYSPKQEEKLLRTYSVYVTAKNGITLYAGPNEQYEPIAQIPHGTTLTYEYGNDPDTYFRTWAYVTYRNQNGWIYVYANDMQNGVAEIPGDDEEPMLWVLQGSVPVYSGTSYANIRDKLDEYETEFASQEELQQKADRIIGKLEAENKYPYLYRHRIGFNAAWYCVRLGLRTGWVFLGSEGGAVAVNTANYTDSTMTFKTTPITLWNNPITQSEKTQFNLPKETVLKPTYSLQADDGNYYYLTVQGHTGWCNSAGFFDEKAQNTNAFDFGSDYAVNRSGKSAPIYSDIMQKDKVLGTIPAGARFTSLYHGDYAVENPDDETFDYYNFDYVRYQGVSGWVDAKDFEAPDTQEPIAEPETEAQETETTQAQAEETQPETEPETAEETEPADTTAEPIRGLAASQIVLLCVGGAVILTLTAVVTLVLIRRRRANAPKRDDEETEEIP